MYHRDIILDLLTNPNNPHFGILVNALNKLQVDKPELPKVNLCSPASNDAIVKNFITPLLQPIPVYTHIDAGLTRDETQHLAERYLAPKCLRTAIENASKYYDLDPASIECIHAAVSLSWDRAHNPSAQTGLKHWEYHLQAYSFLRERYLHGEHLSLDLILSTASILLTGDPNKYDQIKKSQSIRFGIETSLACELFDKDGIYEGDLNIKLPLWFYVDKDALGFSALRSDLDQDSWNQVINRLVDAGIVFNSPQAARQAAPDAHSITAFTSPHFKDSEEVLIKLVDYYNKNRSSLEAAAMSKDKDLIHGVANLAATIGRVLGMLQPFPDCNSRLSTAIEDFICKRFGFSLPGFLVGVTTYDVSNDKNHVESKTLISRDGRWMRKEDRAVLLAQVAELMQ